MFWRLIGLGAALCLVLMPATGVAGEPDKPADEAAEADPKPTAKKSERAKKKLVVDFSETKCEPPDCVIEGERHEPQVQYVITRRGVFSEADADFEASMRREEQSLRRAAQRRAAAETAPADKASAETAPAEKASAETAPAEKASAETAPAEGDAAAKKDEDASP